MVTLNILGCGSATPTVRHLPSCQVLDRNDRLMMFDCGEGAQLQMRRLKLRFSRLRHIFISHIHGDHFLGLPGLLSTLALHDTGGTITIHCFRQGAEILQQMMRVFCRETSFDICYDIIEPATGTVYEDDSLTVSTFPLYHRVPAVGYLVREKPKLRHIDGEAVRFHGVSHAWMNRLRQGADYEAPDGRIIPNAHLTRPADPSMSYAYCSDTMYDERVAEAVAGVDTLYHESTYLADNLAKAAARGHSTAGQAGRIATLAGARRLILGHYSQAYDDDRLFAAEAATTFAGPIIPATEGLRLDLTPMTDSKKSPGGTAIESKPRVKPGESTDHNN